MVKPSTLALSLAAAILPGLAHAKGAIPDAAHSMATIERAGRLACGTIQAAEDWNGQDQHGDLSVLTNELCHAVAAAVLGDAARVEIVAYPGEPDALAGLHSGALQLVMGVTPSVEAAMQWGIGYGPAVFYDTERFLVLKQAGLSGVADLKDKLVCAMENTPAERTLRDEMTARGIPYALQAHSEQGEMDESRGGCAVRGRGRRWNRGWRTRGRIFRRRRPNLYFCRSGSASNPWCRPGATGTSDSA